MSENKAAKEKISWNTQFYRIAEGCRDIFPLETFLKVVLGV